MDLNDNHWKDEDYTQRMTTKDWKKILLEEKDRLIFRGYMRQLVAKSIGYGLVEVGKRGLPRS